MHFVIQSLDAQTMNRVRSFGKDGIYASSSDCRKWITYLPVKNLTAVL